MASLEHPAALLPWALSTLGAAPKEEARLQTVAGDASNRRYFRLNLGAQSWVLLYAPPALENNEAFLAVARLLDQAGIRVPRIEAFDLEEGFALLEDLGDELLLPLLTQETAGEYYPQAMDILLQMAALSGHSLKTYDAALLAEELGRFEEWFVAGLLDYQMNAQEQAMLTRLFQRLTDSALEQPTVFVHRDFHSRNLMRLPSGQLAVIDFQDAVHGPITYDIVSLLRDCYIRWPEDRVREWALHYKSLLIEREYLVPIDDLTFLRWFDWMGLQRHIKVLGTFARLHLRDGKQGYLADLPLVIHYVERVVRHYTDQEPEFAEFSDWFEERLAPKIARQPWSGAP